MKDPEHIFEESDDTSAFEQEVVDFQSMIARLSAHNSEIPIARIATLVLTESEAMTGGIPVAVPAAVYNGVQELINLSRTVDASG